MATARKKVTSANPRRVERFTLNSTQATDKEVFLANAPTDPNSVTLNIPSGTIQFLNQDYAVDGNRVYWTGLALETVLELNDRIVIVYN